MASECIGRRVAAMLRLLWVAAFVCVACWDARMAAASGGGGEADPGDDTSSVIPKHILKHKWSYHHKRTGPPNWEKLFKSCGGQFQSPIDIESAKAVNWGTARFELKGYDKVPDSMYLQNNGHTAMLVPEKTVPPSIKGGDLSGEFELVQVHFHWGTESIRGSEHFINGEAFPLEMHLVHYNAKFPSISKALETNDHDALAVLGFLFEISPEDNGRLDSLIARLDQLRASNGTVVFPKKSLFRMADLIDLDDDEGVNEEFNIKYADFYRYEGSLTTPTCNEQVEWTVFPTTIPISERQMGIFRKLLDHKGYTLNDNYRPVFPLGGRLLRKYSANASNDESSRESNPNRLNTVLADFVSHDHEHDHDIFHPKDHYARPDIKEILDEEVEDAEETNLDSASVLRERLQDCQRMRMALLKNSASYDFNVITMLFPIFFVVFGRLFPIV